MPLLEDAEILSLFREENTRSEAFNLLLKKHQQRVYWHIRRMVINHDDADDLVQEVFIKVWKNLGTFREDAQLFTWIYRIATNECITFLNRKKMRNNVSLGEDSDYLVQDLQSEAYLTADAIQLKLQKALLTLPDKQRLVFNMKYFDDLKYEEISEMLGTSVGALKASYHLAIKKIEKYFEEHD